MSRSQPANINDYIIVIGLFVISIDLAHCACPETSRMNTGRKQSSSAAVGYSNIVLRR